MLLLDAVRERCGSDSVIEAHRLLTYEQTADSVTATFEDRGAGRTVTVEGPLLVAADGLHSAARRQRFPDEGPPLWGGAVLWRGTAPCRPIRTGASFTLVENSSNASSTTRSAPSIPPLDFSGRTSSPSSPSIQPWAGMLQAGIRPSTPQVFLPAFADWDFDWLDIPALVGRAEQVWEYPMVDRNPAPTWIDGREALLGDAAHVMYPVGSNGASQAIVDARVLGASLVEHRLSPDALAAF